MKKYNDFLDTKLLRFDGVGITPGKTMPSLKPFQALCVKWALTKGRFALFADTGLGKTLMFLEWARQISRLGRVLILAPLGVTAQHVQEGRKWGVDAQYDPDGSGEHAITITNYDRLHHFNASDFIGIVLDESSILKNFTGKIRTAIIHEFAATPYRLACTATPAPNDQTELGNHAEFLGVMTRQEMLARYFVHDGGSTKDWRIKGHATDQFWQWVCTWAGFVKRPSDLGFDDAGYDLPALRMHSDVVMMPHDGSAILSASDKGTQGMLLATEAVDLAAQRTTRRVTMDARVDRAALIAEQPGPCIVWCELNAEADAIEKAVPDAVQIAGRHDRCVKMERMAQFTAGEIRVLVTKPKIAGMGMNWQHCGRQVFLGASHSYEQTYQAIRRSWRFGRTEPVDVHIIHADNERHIVRNYERKAKLADEMSVAMVQHMAAVQRTDTGTTRAWTKYDPKKNMQYDGGSRTVKVIKQNQGERYQLYQGDAVEVVAGIESESIDYSIFSPPFASLYTYSSSPRDMGNVVDDDTFFEQLRFLVRDIHRVTASGRLLSMHCMMLPSSKSRHGVIGLRDFRGELIRLCGQEGWIFHSEVTIWKDPVTAMQRTKALGLLYKQVKKDSTMSRQGIADYLITLRKPGVNQKPVSHRPVDFPVSQWQKWASPVWMDINASNTLQHRSAREDKDERHICPLQLEVIERGVTLWSNPGDTVLSPFMGIGSEGVEAVRLGRKFVGIELKESYYDQAAKNLHLAENVEQQEMKV